MASAAADASNEEDCEKTIPGQSRSLRFLSSVISCEDLVRPGVDPTPQTLLRLRELITDDFPTLKQNKLKLVLYFQTDQKCNEIHLDSQ